MGRRRFLVPGNEHVDPAHHEAFAFLKLESGDLDLLQKLDEGGRRQQDQGGALSCPSMSRSSQNLRDNAGLFHARQPHVEALVRAGH